MQFSRREFIATALGAAVSSAVPVEGATTDFATMSLKQTADLIRLTLDSRIRLEMSTAEIGLSVRTTNCLEEKGIFTVNDLLHCTRDDLLSISNFGEKTLEEVYKALEGVGFYRRAKRELATA